MKSNSVTKWFHGFTEYEGRRVQEDDGSSLSKRRYFIVQERDVRYRFSTHYHPYVGSLTQKLLRGGLRELQAADTLYAENRAALPGSLEISLDQQVAGSSVSEGMQIRLADNQDFTLPDATTLPLTAGTQLRLVVNTSLTLPAGTRAALVEGMTDTPTPGTVIPLPPNSLATLIGDTSAKLDALTRVVLQAGLEGTLPPDTPVLLESGDLVTFPNGINVTLEKSQPRPVLYAPIFSEASYSPSPLVARPYPVRDLDFSVSGAYSVYNWEMFFHVPLMIAMHLSKNQRFAEAQRWFHYLFDPTDDSDGPTPERFWKVRPFQSTDVKRVEEILVNLATEADETLRNETINSIQAWQDAPFRPHVIARFRQQAYMYKTVMAYLDNLIAWGDSLFRQDTGEAIDEALMLYILSATILGPRPQAVPNKGSVRPQTYDNLRKDLKQFGTVMREMETDLGFDLMPLPGGEGSGDDRMATVRSLGKALYFGVPRNDKLMSYWDTVADRLFKIRNSLNIQGVFRQLALFEPPIDPAMLARAAAAGLDIASVVSGMNQPLPLVRFNLLAQKAAEICQEVKSLGGGLLSAMEKEDGEAIAILRAQHERSVLEMVENIKYGQLQEAIKSREGLERSLELAIQRYSFYQQQLGKGLEEIKNSIPELSDLDKDGLEKRRFNMKEPVLNLADLEVDISKDLNDSGGKIISSFERQEYVFSKSALDQRDEAATLDMIAKFLSLIPELGAQAEPMGVGAALEFGGRALSTQLSLAPDGNKTMADQSNFSAGQSSKIDMYSRRQLDWTHQSNLAAGEISQIYKQIRAAEIREALAEMELKNHRKQTEQAREIEHFLNEEGVDKTGKKTNKALYTWMKREVKGLYGQFFQFAFDVARKAERALQHELGNVGLTYLQYDYLAGKEGLLAGEKLYLDIKRMEMAYHDLNQREYEMAKNISLLQVDPIALMALRITGRCTVRLPETLFDMDGPGHYFRRIKSVAITIPCVAGPYSGVNCTLTLLKSSIRRNSALRGDIYSREDAEDDRFSDYFGSVQSIVTSTAQNDSGLFETNLRDERYLPFENAGVISEWQLELPADPSKKEPTQFDYNTISDVILHIRYTAREGGLLLRKGALKTIKDLAENARVNGCTRLFSMRYEFPSEWARFQSQKPATGQRFELAVGLRKEHYPYWAQIYLNAVEKVEVLARSSAAPIPSSLDVFANADSEDQAKKAALTKDTSMGNLLRGSFETGALPAKPVDEELHLFFDSTSLSDVWIAVTWKA